jgi:hypothetical protein
MLHSFLAGTGELADPGVLSALRIGAPLALERGRAAPRFGGRSRIEVRTPEGRALGYLPPDDEQLLASLLDAGASVMVRVRGMFPAFQRPRVQLELEIVPAATDPA